AFARIAGAGGRQSRAGPTVREVPVYVIKRIHLANEGGHLLREVRGEHARGIELRRLAVRYSLTLRGAPEPLGPGLQRFAVSEIAVQPGHDANPPRLRGLGEIAEKIAIPQELAPVMQRNFGGIERYDAAGVEQQRVHFETTPVVDPLRDIEL